VSFDTLFWAVALVLTVAVTLGVLVLADALQTGDLVLGFDLRPTILCISLVGLSVLSYVGWPSRWNVVAHAQLAFSVVAFIIPIYFLDTLNRLSSDALDLYYQVCAVGFLVSLVAAMVGRAAGTAKRIDRLVGARDFDSFNTDKKIAGRVFALSVLCIGGVLVSFAVMGFIPAFAADPFAAKFFRGPYAAPYAPVAPLYRASTTVIALLLPLVALLAWKIRTPAWVVVFIGSVGVMLLGLLRDPAVTGVLLLIGILFAARRKGLFLYLLMLTAVYFVGGGLYYFLTLLGVPGYSLHGGAPLLAQVAAGAPDVTDQVTFLRWWMLHPEYTNGLTWVGGLVPGNFQWNPSVWSLSVVNPGQNVANISSGGLRLPAPIWGLVSFGWPGAIGVSALSGFLIGYLARLAGRITPSQSLTHSVFWLLLYLAVLDVVPVFYRLSYLSVIQLGVVIAVLFWGTKNLGASSQPVRWEKASDKRLRKMLAAPKPVEPPTGKRPPARV
jgi:hypothetical protein